MIFGAYLIHERSNPKRLYFKNAPILQSVVTSVYPQELVINGLGIDLPIFPAKITQNNWQTTTQGVSYLQNSPLPGETGNSILYGHNWESLLGRLPLIKPGDTLVVIFSNGIRKKFQVMYTTIVNPDNTSILINSHDKRITIYTCTGFLDTKRFVAVATLAS